MFITCTNVRYDTVIIMNDDAVKYSNKLLAVKAYVGISRYLEHACLECVHWLKNWSSFLLVIISAVRCWYCSMCGRK